MKMLTIIIFGLMMVLMSLHTKAIISDNIIGCWDFAENYSSSVNVTTTLTPYNQTQKSNGFGDFNASVEFDGSGDNLINDSSYINLTNGDWTICEWYNSTATNVNKALFSYGGSPDFNIIAYQLSGTKYDYFLSQDGSTWAGYTSNVGSYSANMWTHTCIRRNDTHYNLWINGTLLQSRTISNGALIIQNKKIKLGCWWEHCDNSQVTSKDFSGKITGLKIWNRSLTQVEMRSDWNNGNGRNCGNLVSIENSTPTIIINTPSNNSKSHNATPFINFTINTTSPNLNFTFEVYLDTSNPPTTRINRSENFTTGIFIINSYTITTEVADSINGTYFLKINGTDNATNVFNIFNTLNITNNLDSITNVTLNLSGIGIGNTIKGFYNLTSVNLSGVVDYDNYTKAWTKWYINKTEILEAENNSILLGGTGNVTNNANITFSASVEDGYGATSRTAWVNSSTATVGDVTFPSISAQAITTTTPITTDFVNLSINCTDSGTIQYARVELNVSGNTISNITLTSLGNNVFADARTYSLGFHNITKFYCADGSGNIANDTSNFTFTVSNPPSGGGSIVGGGGGGTTETIIIREGIPLLSFGGLTLIDFNVLATPSKKVKIVRFKNVGNVTFEKATTSIEGDAKKFIKPFICDLNMQNCRNSSVSIKAGESMLLTLNGTFNEELGKGTSGAIKIQEQKTNGNTHELNLLVSRPPLYTIAVKPLADTMGIPELLAFIIVYISTGVIIIGGIWFATIL